MAADFCTAFFHEGGGGCKVCYDNFSCLNVCFLTGAAYLFALTFGMGALGIWYAMLCDWGFRAIVFSLRWISGGWKNKSII